MQPGKVDRQRAYVLHAQPYRETSLLLDVFSAEHGRVALVARGARRPRAELRGLLLPFQPLALSWFGKGEVRTVHKAEWLGGVRMLSGQALVCGFYLNEIVARLSVRDDPSVAAWQAYDTAVRALAVGTHQATVLRRFELALLQALGYAPAFETDAGGTALDADALYRVAADAAPIRWDGGPPPGGGQAVVRGATLLALQSGEFAAGASLREARSVTRLMLANLLGDDRLATRELLLATSPGATEAE